MKEEYHPTYVLRNGKVERNENEFPLFFNTPREARDYIKEMERLEPDVKRTTQDASEIE